MYLDGRTAGTGAPEERRRRRDDHPEGRRHRLARLLGDVRGRADPALAYAWINACLDPTVGKILSDEERYGNTTNEAANVRHRHDLWRPLTFLLTPENYDKRVQVWNEVKAA